MGIHLNMEKALICSWAVQFVMFVRVGVGCRVLSELTQYFIRCQNVLLAREGVMQKGDLYVNTFVHFVYAAVFNKGN